MTIRFFIRISLLLASLVSAGCASTAANPGEALTACPETRPKVCTMEYNPVCARRKDGSHKTYSNGCVSCSDTEVAGYKAGVCK